MDYQYQDALTTPCTTLQPMLSSDPSSQRSNVLEFRRLDPGSIAMNRVNGILIMTSCRPMTKDELGVNDTSGTLFEGHIAPGKLHKPPGQEVDLDKYCQAITDIVNHPKSRYVMIEAAAEVEHKLGENTEALRGEFDQKVWKGAASQVATVLQVQHELAEGVPRQMSISQFNGVQPGFVLRLQNENARGRGYSDERNTADELVRLMQGDYGQETLRAMAADWYQPPETEGHVVFRNPNGDMHWIQKGTEIGNSLEGETRKSTGTNGSGMKKKSKRFIRCGQQYRKAAGVERVRLQNPSSSQLPKTGHQIGSHFGPGTPVEAATQTPAETFGGYLNNGLDTDPHGSMFQNETQYVQAMSEDQPWAPNSTLGNWLDRPAQQIYPSLQPVQASHPESLPLGLEPLKGNFSDSSSSQNPAFG
jgi:hypothetical protein